MLFKTKGISFSLKIYDLLFECNTERDIAVAMHLVEHLTIAVEKNPGKDFIHVSISLKI